MSGHVQIRRNAGSHDFIPAYPTHVLLQGVCHLTHVRQKDLDHISRTERQRISIEKFEDNKEQIYTLLANGRGVKDVATQFRISYDALVRYLKEEEIK